MLCNFLGTNFLLPKSGHRREKQPVLGTCWLGTFQVGKLTSVTSFEIGKLLFLQGVILVQKKVPTSHKMQNYIYE